MCRIVQADSKARIAQVRELFQEYARGLGVDLCFQGFNAELAHLPGSYGPPQGRLLLALEAGRPLGCIGLRPQSPRVCEMKRLYVRPAARGRGLGRRLVLELLQQAEALGYRRMLLDTLPEMGPARGLYRSLGFRETPGPGAEAVEGCIYMEIDLPRPGPEASPDA